MAEGLRLTPDWQPECCPVCACAYDPSYVRLLDVVVATRPPVACYLVSGQWKKRVAPY